MLRRWLPWACLAMLTSLRAADLPPDIQSPADLILLDARIYTANKRTMADALVLRGDRLLYVGTGASALNLVLRPARLPAPG